MKIEEFLNADSADNERIDENNGEFSSPQEIDVQKAVVESLAADKVEQDEELRTLRQDIAIRNGQIKAQNAMISSLHEEISSLKEKLAGIERKLADELTKEFDTQERNPNSLALIDRDVEVPDRFPGESRDHVIEVLSEAYKTAEKEGRIRRAQILESVLVSNEPNGTLANRRTSLENLFSKNGNIVNGSVIAELDRLGISHKNGEEYLLPSEILKRNY